MLKGISFNVKKGEKIAFVGRTGSGKSSILNVLLRFYDFQSGSINLFGRDIKRDWSIRELRNKISVVPQLGFVFASTVRDNLDPQ